MALTYIKVTRTIEMEIIPTHVPGIDVLYSRWEGDEKFHHVIGPSQELVKLTTKRLTPDVMAPNFPGVENSRFHFFDSIKMVEMQEKGSNVPGNIMRKAFQPTVWGEAPHFELTCYGHDWYNQKLYNLDGSFAITSISLFECWKNYQRKSLEPIFADPKYALRLVCESYHVPGNGDMFDAVFTMSQQQVTDWQCYKKSIGNSLYDVLPFLGLDLKDYQK